MFNANEHLVVPFIQLVRGGSCVSHFSVFCLHIGLLVWAFPQSHKLNLTYCSKSSMLLAFYNKLHAWWWVCMQHAHKEVFACMKLCACKSIKTLFISTPMLFKVVSCFCVWIPITLGTRSNNHNLFHLRSCC